MQQGRPLTKVEIVLKLNELFKVYEDDEAISIEECVSTDELLFFLKEEIINNTDNITFISLELVNRYYFLATLFNDNDDHTIDENEAEEILDKLIIYLNLLLSHLKNRTVKNDIFWELYNTVVYYKLFIENYCRVSTDGSLIWLF